MNALKFLRHSGQTKDNSLEINSESKSDKPHFEDLMEGRTRNLQPG